MVVAHIMNEHNEHPRGPGSETGTPGDQSYTQY